jgi:hypothetical protein
MSLRYRIDVLRLFSKPLKQIQADPQTAPYIRMTIDAAFLRAKDVFPLTAIDHRPEHIEHLHKVSDAFAAVLGCITNDPEVSPSNRALIEQTFIKFGNMACSRREFETLPYDLAKREICAVTTNISPPRRPALQVYEPGDERPREVMVFRR